MVVDQRLLGLRNGLLDRIQLLGNVEVRPLRLDHLDDAARVTFGAPQALDDFRVGLVDRVPAQGHIPSPLREYACKNFRRASPSADQKVTMPVR